MQKFKKNGAASMTGINATCQLHFQVNWVKPFIVVLIITEHNRGQQVYSSLKTFQVVQVQEWLIERERTKSTFLGKESTSPMKVVNCTQSR